MYDPVGMDPLKIAVFGAGRMGKEHIRNLLSNKEVSVAYIVARSDETLQSLKEEFPILEHNSRCPCEFLRAENEDRVFLDKRY